MPTIWIAVLLLELGFAAGGGAELLGCQVALAERMCVPGETSAGDWLLLLGPLAAVALGAIVWRARTDRGLVERTARALLPLLGLGVPLALARLSGGPPAFAVAVLAPIAVGAAVARLVARSWGARRVRGRLPALAVGAACLAVSIAFARDGLRLLDGFALGHADAGEYAVRLEGTLRGRFLGGRTDLGLFFDHWNPGLALLVPPYALLRRLLPGTHFVTVAQAVLIASAALVAFGLARRRLGDPVAAALAALALLVSPALTHLNVAYSYGFHPVSMALAPLLGAAWAYAAGRKRLAIVLVVLAWSFEETVAPATFGAGVALALHRERRRAGALLAAGSVAYFLVATRLILPMFAAHGDHGEHGYRFVEFFGSLGGSMTEIALSPVTRPTLFWPRLLDGATAGFLATLLAPALLLPLARPRWLVASVPVLAFACLREDEHLKSITQHYHNNVVPWIFLGLVEAIRGGAWPARVLGIAARGRARRRALAAGALGASLAGAVLYGDGPLGGARRPFQLRPGVVACVAAVASAIPEGARLVVTNRLAAHLAATHPDLRPLALELPPADFYALDLDDTWSVVSVPRVRRFARDLRSAGFHPVAARGPILVLARTGPEIAPRLESRGSDAPPLFRFARAGLALLEVQPLPGGRARLVWRVEAPTPGDWGLVPFARSGSRVEVTGEVDAIGPAERPTYVRAAGEVFAEERGLNVPEGASLELEVFDFIDLDRRGVSVPEAVEELAEARAQGH